MAFVIALAEHLLYALLNNVDNMAGIRCVAANISAGTIALGEWRRHTRTRASAALLAKGSLSCLSQHSL